ncbi:hypothetical protein Y032_0008g270 [Ancylostoma ceylanicum]|nr:hypothetical protein Y032_0008g270 [Ancylostoma ceylanicum]
MSNPGRIGVCASSSREDVSRSRNTPVRRVSSFTQQDVVLPSASSAVRGNHTRRWTYRRDPPQQMNAVAVPNQNNHCQNFRRHNWSNNVREKSHQGRHQRRNRNYSSCQSAVEDMDTTDDVPQFPGFVFDPVTRRHFRIAADHSGINNYTHKDILRRRRETERCQHLAQKRSFHIKRSCTPTVTAVHHLSLGARNFNHTVRSIYENRLLHVGSIPNAVQETYLSSSSEQVKGCQFLDIVGSGEDAQILGCWAIGDGSRNSRKASKLACFRARFDDAVARKAAIDMDKLTGCDVSTSLNTLGLEFVLDGETVDISEPVLVDMTVAPVDSDVTCVLYVTAESRVTEQGILSMCNVVLQPMSALCTDDDDFEVRNSPIYNIRWSVESSAIYSCAWNSNKTRIALGMEDTAKIMDVITEKSFVISSRRRNVISQHFTSDGDLIYMGLRDSDVILSDLRMKSHHVTGSLKGSRSAGWIRQLRLSYPQCVLIENFRGELKLYDLRRSDRELMSFSGHRNTHFRLPCTVDCQENFVFAVGSDGCTRGWSLASGDQLCAVPCPRPVDDRTDFPRVVYSSAWAGRAGSSALVLAVGDSLRIHHVEL